MKQKISWIVIISSLIGIISLVLSYLVHWSFAILTLFAFIINQRELMKNNK
jgi:hypothetical protein